MKWKIARLAQTLGSITLVAASCLAQAQNAYPVKPITMYVGFAAGSATDIIARVITQKLSQQLGQPIIVQNLVEAGSTIATAAVTRAAPDGYTLLTVSGALTIIPTDLQKPQVRRRERPHADRPHRSFAGAIACQRRASRAHVQRICSVRQKVP
ncbi:hypothetical protein LP414_31970 [Polaromonas sp. P1(28)-13]|nr:hypothetical protein LP414_31970 [Polaromonas sp. P1(28)-13]